MSSDKNGLEGLRAEHQSLSSRITRLSLIHISLLTIVTFTIGNGLDKVDVRDQKRDLDTAHYIAQALFEAYLSKKVESNGILDPEKERLRDEWMKAFDKEQDMQKKQDALLKEEFSISPSVLGSSLNIDLRSWVYCIPFVTLFVFLYIQILRKKQTVISTIGAARVNETDEVAKLDLLMFSHKSEVRPAFERSSSQLEAAAHLVIVALLLTLIISALADTEVVFLGLQPLEIVEYCLMFFTAGCFAISYYYYESAALDLQASIITDREIAPGLALRTWRRATSRTHDVLSRLKPRVSLTTAALLVLASLFLSTAASCEGPLPGHTMLRQDQGHWVTSIVNVKNSLYWQDAINLLGRGGYLIGLVLALTTLILVACSILRIKIRKGETVHLFLFFASGALSLMTIADLSFSAFWFKDELFLLSNAFWLFPSSLLYWLVFTNTANRAGVRSLFVTVVLPLFVVAMVYSSYSAWIGYRGVLVYFAGITLMALSYLRVVMTDRQKHRARVNQHSASP